MCHHADHLRDEELMLGEALNMLEQGDYEGACIALRERLYLVQEELNNWEVIDAEDDRQLRLGVEGANQTLG